MKIYPFTRNAFMIGAKSRLLKDYLPVETAWFKTLFSAKKGQSLRLGLFAASRYCLYVNGEMAFNGPQKGDKNASFVDSVEIGPFLRDGQNVLALKVTSYPPAEAYLYNRGVSNIGPYGVTGTASGPCLLAVTENQSVDLSTGYAEWFVMNDASVDYDEFEPGFIMGGMENVNAALASAHCTDDSLEGFEPAVSRWIYRAGISTELAPFMLYERTLPAMRLDAPEHFEKITAAVVPGCEKIDLRAGQTLPAHGRFSVDLDAQALQTAYFSIAFRGGKGAKVEIHYAEAYSSENREGAYPMPVKGRRDDCERFDFLGLVDRLTLDGREFTYQPFWFRTFRFVRIVIETAGEALTVAPPTFRTTRYPLQVRAKIEPEQQWVKALWDISVRTLELCMHETHEDCPYYEQLQYILDTRLQMLFTYALSADTRMAENVIYFFHSSLLPEGLLQSRYPCTAPQVIPVFALHWIGMLSDYQRQTGSDRLTRRYRTTMESILEWYHRKVGASGMAERLGYWEFFDWPEQWGSGHAGTPTAAVNEGVSACENLVYAYFTGLAADLLESIGHTQLADYYRAQRASVLDSVQRLCWDEEKQLYREGPTTREYSQHAQAYAVLCGLISGDEATALMRRALSDKTLVQCTYPLQFALFRALERVGLYEETGKQWELWKVLLGENLTTIPEVPGPQARSDCHAWGAQLLFEYPRRILGVYPDLPGYARIGVRPMGLYLGQAAGEVPTPMGMVSVRWTMKDGRFSMEAKWPAGVPARITLPDGRVIDSEAGAFRVE